MVTELCAKWQDYLFLTQEMRKFLAKRDLEMFFSLLEQRGNLQIALEELTDEVYYHSPEGKSLLLQVQQEDQKLMLQFQRIFNNMKKQEDVSKAYDSKGNQAGSFINSTT